MTAPLDRDRLRADVLAGLGMCSFKEDVNDGSMCQCGLPALNHDPVAADVVLRDHPWAKALLDALDEAERSASEWKDSSARNLLAYNEKFNEVARLTAELERERGFYVAMDVQCQTAEAERDRLQEALDEHRAHYVDPTEHAQLAATVERVKALADEMERECPLYGRSFWRRLRAAIEGAP